MREMANGARVAIIESHGLPIVVVSAMFDLPDAFDPPGKEGVGGITGAMLREGTTSRRADQISDATAELGNDVSPNGFTTVTANVDSSLALMADELLHPAWPDAALTRIKAGASAQVKAMHEHSGYFASRVLANVVNGSAHPYAQSGTEESIAAVTKADLVAYHDAYYRPRNVTFLIAGDITPDVAVAKLERAFAGWARGGVSGQHPVAAPQWNGPTRIYLYDRPGSVQSTIIVGTLGPRRDAPDYYALELMNAALGGAFNSRLNLDLREKHGWTYGVHSGFRFRSVPELGTFQAGADVATPKTDSALVAMMADITGLTGAKPVTDSEVAFVRRKATMGLPLEFANLSEVAGAEAGLLGEHLPLDYYDHLVARYDRVTVADVERAAVQRLDPKKLAIVIVGDRKVIEAGLRAANVAPVVVVNERGEPIGS
jgi:zinc protease